MIDGMPGLGLGMGNGMPGDGTLGQEMSDGLLSRGMGNHPKEQACSLVRTGVRGSTHWVVVAVIVQATLSISARFLQI